MKQRKQYTNGEKIEYFRKKISEYEIKIKQLEELPKNEYQSQNWNQNVSSQINDARLQMLEENIKHLADAVKTLIKEKAPK